MQIRFEPPNQPDVIALINELDAYQMPLYPLESYHGLDIASLSQPHVHFAVARDSSGQAIGCGGLVLGADYGELKRMYLKPLYRGQGFAQRLLTLLEHRATEHGCRLIMLETGVLQPEAIAFYLKSGYVECGPFGDYWADPNSLFMRKPLA